MQSARLLRVFLCSDERRTVNYSCALVHKDNKAKLTVFPLKSSKKVLTNISFSDNIKLRSKTALLLVPARVSPHRAEEGCRASYREGAEFLNENKGDLKLTEYLCSFFLK